MVQEDQENQGPALVLTLQVPAGDWLMRLAQEIDQGDPGDWLSRLAQEIGRRRAAGERLSGPKRLFAPKRMRQKNRARSVRQVTAEGADFLQSPPAENQPWGGGQSTITPGMAEHFKGARIKSPRPRRWWNMCILFAHTSSIGFCGGYAIRGDINVLRNR